MDDPLVDIAWDRDSLLIFNWFGTKEVSITETWTFEKADDRWTLGFWDRTLLEHQSGALWGEFTNLRTGRIVAEYFGTGDSPCSAVTGCGHKNKLTPYKTSCTDLYLSSDIGRISEYRFRELGCNIRYIIKKKDQPSGFIP
jgi:hypothetical protein